MSLHPGESHAPDAGVFATTRWSIVLSAKGKTTSAQAALAKLCETYWYPLYAFVRRQGYSPADAQDLTQEFFLRLLAKGWLGDVERERGRFRSFLLASIKHFLANEWNRAHCAKRGGPAPILSLDANAGEDRYRQEPAEPATAEHLYDRRWALTLLDRVMTQLRKEMSSAGRLPLFEALKSSLAGEKCAYADLAQKLGMSEGAIKVAAHRLRARYRALLRGEIAQTVSTANEIDAELRYLLATLAG